MPATYAINLQAHNYRATWMEDLFSKRPLINERI